VNPTTVRPELLGRAFETASVGIALLDRELRFIACNGALAAIDGVPVAQHPGRRATDILPGLDVAAFEQMRDAVRTGEASSAVITGPTPVHPDARRHWVSTVTPLEDADGRVEAVSVVLVDVTDLELARAEARARSEDLDRALASGGTEQLLLAVVEAMPVGVSVVRPDGALVHNNRALLRIWRGNRRSMSLDEYGEWAGFHPDGRRYTADEWPMARTVRTGEVVAGEEIAIERFDGTRGTISLSSAQIVDQDGQLLGVVGVVTDITEEHEAVAARDAFLGILSHELRTPVTTIFGMTKLLERYRADVGTTAADLIRDVGEEAERLARLVEDLLVVSRVERGLRPGGDDPVLLQHLVPAVAEREELREADVTFRVHPAARLPTVAGDAGYIEQIVRNLLSNAAKYARGEVDITFGATDHEVVVTVADRGPGVPDEPERLFELFHREQPSRRMASGAGIGLFVVRQLAEGMGGRAWAEPRDGGGACFCVAFRRFEEQLD
jgi:PAS domain S-box-containing protein